MAVTLGYDVGGAHLKIARIASGRVETVRSIPCPLWEGIERLDAAFADCQHLTDGAEVFAITMTGELTEIFDGRVAGVAALCDRLSARFGDQARFYMGLKGFGSAAQAKADPFSVASANFLATASIVARRRPRAILIDMGSTTTDIIACDRPQGLSDAERLQTGELVYTGYTRTPVPSVTTRAPLAGQWQTLARDTFATMADVRRILGLLADGLDVHATSDGRGTSVEESLVRFARGFGRDGALRHLKVWQHAAAFVRDMQLRTILDGAHQVLSRPAVDVSTAVVAGIGCSEADAVAQRLGLVCDTFGALIGAPETSRVDATHHAAAVAVGLLASS